MFLFSCFGAWVRSMVCIFSGFGWINCLPQKMMKGPDFLKQTSLLGMHRYQGNTGWKRRIATVCQNSYSFYSEETAGPKVSTMILWSTLSAQSFFLLLTSFQYQWCRRVGDENVIYTQWNLFSHKEKWNSEIWRQYLRQR